VSRRAWAVWMLERHPVWACLPVIGLELGGMVTYVWVVPRVLFR